MRLSILLLLCLAATLDAEMVNGSAIITSRQGEIAITTDNSKLHDVLEPNGLEIATQKDGKIFITFSNGVAIGLDTASQVECLEYKQRPFSEKGHNIGFEPSVSKLHLLLKQGQIAIAGNRFSPLSELRVRLPYGELRLHKGTCLIRVDSLGLHITAFDGSLTYYYPNSDEREFISAPAGVRISEQSAALFNVAEKSTVESLLPEEIHLCRAAQHASQRVHFEANDTTSDPPQPVLIVNPEYFEQTALRPYQYKE